MFKQTLNLARIQLRLCPQGPFLIKAAESLDPTRPSMEFVRIFSAVGPTVYVPGSSLKGVVRSTAEALFRTLGENPCDASDPKRLCPVVRKDRKKNPEEKLAYLDHCPVCQTFGSTELASRVHFADLFPWRPKEDAAAREGQKKELERHLGIRMGISIDRRKGSVAHGPFEMEILTGGTLYGEVSLRNYSLWQLGLLFFVFERLDEGSLKVGFGKSRGLGRVALEVDQVMLEQFGPLKGRAGVVIGLAESAFQALARGQGLEAEDLEPLPLQAGILQEEKVFSRLITVVGEDQIRPVKEALIQKLKERFDHDGQSGP